MRGEERAGADWLAQDQAVAKNHAVLAKHALQPCIDQPLDRAPEVARHTTTCSANGKELPVLGDARELQLDEPVDLINNRLLGDFGSDENIVECVAGFARRNLAGGGRVLPQRLRTYLVPVEYGDEFRGVWRRDFHGIDLRTALDEPYQPEAVMVGCASNRPSWRHTS